MVNRQKSKGYAFERLATEILNRHVKNSVWRRVPNSGALGTTMGEPILMSDIHGRIEGFHRKFRVETKSGYGGATQVAVKKAWLDKIREEADSNFAIPILMCKFSGARDGTKIFAVMDIDAFIELLNSLKTEAE